MLTFLISIVRWCARLEFRLRHRKFIAREKYAMGFCVSSIAPGGPWQIPRDNYIHQAEQFYVNTRLTWIQDRLHINYKKWELV